MTLGFVIVMAWLSLALTFNVVLEVLIWRNKRKNGWQ